MYHQQTVSNSYPNPIVIATCLTSNLADHDDALGLRIFHKTLQAINEVRGVEEFASDSHSRTLPQPIDGINSRRTPQGFRYIRSLHYKR